MRAITSRDFDLLNRIRVVSTAPAGGGSGWASRCAYDDIGNRTASKDGGDDSGLGLRSSAYTRNSLNQYTGRANAPTLYDGWACLAELNAGNNAYVAGYAWGLDLSGTTTGAGGVGGLLWMRPSGGAAHFAAHDGNGNVIGLVDGGTGQESARYEYDPFGNTIRLSGPGTIAKDNPFRFSTKRTERESGLVLYEYRPYSTLLGRWPNRDPIGEKGGANLYGFCGSDPLGHFDPFGLESVQEPGLTKPLTPENIGNMLGVLSGYTCVKEISGQVLRDYCQGGPRQDPTDTSCRQAHCIVNCRIKRECIGGGATAWAASWYKELFSGTQARLAKPWYEWNSWGDVATWFTRWNPTDSPGDMVANRTGREISCQKEKACEVLCKEQLDAFKDL